MVQDDRIELLREGAVERMAVELKAMVELHKNMGRMYLKHGFEEAHFIERCEAGLYESFYREIKGMSK